MNFLPLTMRTNLVFALVLVAFPIAIFCTGPAATEVPVKDDFVAPKSSIVALINELHASAPLDYFANLSTKVSSLTSADFVPTASASEFSFYLKDTTETAETYITNIVSNAATDDAAIAELVKFEDLSTEVTNSIPPTVPISLKAFSDFIVMFDFTDGKFAKSNAATKAWNFTLDEFMDYFKFYVSAQGDKDNLVKNIVEEVNKKNCKSNDEVKTELCSFLSGKFQDKSTGNIEITFTELKTALLTIVIDDSFQLSQGTPAGTTKSLFLDGDTAAFKKLLESDQTKTFVTFIDTATTEVETIFSSIALSTNGDNGNAQLKSTFDNLATLLNNYAKNLFKKTIAKDELNKIFTAKFSAPLPAITDTDISDDDCKIGSLPYLIPDPADTKACFNEYVLFLKDKNKFTNPRQLSIAQIMTILKSNLTEFKTALEDKKRADDAQMAADKEQQEKDDGGKTKEAGEKKKEEGEKQTTSSNSPADGKKKDAPLKSTTSQPKKGMPSYIIALIWAGGITAGIGVIGGIWYFFNKQGSKV